MVDFRKLLEKQRMDTKTAEQTQANAATGNSSNTMQTSNQMDDAVQALLEGAKGQGLEKVRQGDAAIPFIALLQDLSEQVKSGPGNVEGAKVGMFYNTVSGELFPGETGVTVVPVFFDKVWNLWRKRKAGGGFLGSFKSEKEANDALGKLPNNADFDVVETAQHFVLVHSDTRDSWKPALINLKSTGLKFSRRWVAAMQDVELPAKSGGTFTPPSFGCMYQVTSRTDQKGADTYWTFKYENVGVTPYPVLMAAMEFHKLCSRDLVNINYEADVPIEETTPQAAGPTTRAQDPAAPKL